VDTLLVIVQIVALLCLSALSIYLIIVLVRMREILTSVEKDVKELTSKAVPVFSNLEVITDKFKNVTANIDEQVQGVKESIQSVKEIADSIVAFERQIQQRIEEPVLEAVSFLAAAVKGVRTFVERVRG
jgi:uncharacterized protein YoxC